MSFAFAAAAALAMVSTSGAGGPSQAPPRTMTKMVVRLIAPNVKPGSSAAQPKTIYKAGPHYARIENPVDTRQGQHKVTIIAEPDAYSFNLIDKRGTHAVDQGGEGDLHVPIILPFDPKHNLGELDGLEFGSELEFFEDGGASASHGPTVGGQATQAYEIKSDAGNARLIVRSGSKTPVRVSWTSDDGTYTYEYLSYQEIAFDKSLFDRPPGVTFTQIQPDDSER